MGACPPRLLHTTDRGVKKRVTHYTTSMSQPNPGLSDGRA